MIYNQEKKIFIAKKYSILGSATLVKRAWRSKFKFGKAPDHCTILKISRKFENTGSVHILNDRKGKIS